MSLEQALADNTAAVRELIAVWSKLTAQATKVDKAPAETPVTAAGKPLKAATEAAAKAAATPAAPAPAPVEAAPSAPAAASPSETSVDYPTLQKAVFALAGKSREAAASVAASFGVKTFKELSQDRWAEALGAVQEKLAELENV